MLIMDQRFTTLPNRFAPNTPMPTLDSEFPGQGLGNFGAAPFTLLGPGKAPFTLLGKAPFELLGALGADALVPIDVLNAAMLQCAAFKRQRNIWIGASVGTLVLGGLLGYWASK